MDNYFKLKINEILNQLKDIDFSIPQYFFILMN